MSGFQLTASLASSLAWPLVVLLLLIFAWIKRKDIGKILNLREMPQGRALRRVRAGPVELEWDQLIESTAEKAAEVPLVEAPSPNGLVRQELNAVARSVPTAAVLEASARLEQRLYAIVQQLPDRYRTNLVSTPSRPVPNVLRMVDVLVAAEVISPDIRQVIYNLIQLRNEASHRVGGVDITTEQADDYLALVDRVLDYLNDVSPNRDRS